MSDSQVDKKKEAWGIASLSTGIVSIILFFAPYLGFFLAIFAIVAYAMQKRISETGFATAGLITGVIGLGLNFITGILAIIAFSLGI